MSRYISLRFASIGLFVLLLAIAVVAFALPLTAGADSAGAPPHQITFNLHPNPKFLNCISRFPNDAARAPSAKVTVTRGNLNDTLSLKLKNIKPNLAFDLFTVQRSNLLSNGTVDPSFTNFGLAWYQSDVHANSAGSGTVKIQTILLDQIFGFDPDNALTPTNTFHVGFWFNNPQDAAPCGFSGTTPFNGEHNAGPVAMISVPDTVTGLGPLCTNPNTSTIPATCNP